MPIGRGALGVAIIPKHSFEPTPLPGIVRHSVLFEHIYTPILCIFSPVLGLLDGGSTLTDG